MFKPGPRIRGICLMSEAEARKASYWAAKARTRGSDERGDEGAKSIIEEGSENATEIPSFLTSFLSLLSFLSDSKKRQYG